MTDAGHYSPVSEERRSVTFVRTFAATPERVWAALTEPHELSTWLGCPASLEPMVGGEVRIAFEGEDGVTTGRVLTWEPPIALEYQWHYPGEDRSVVRYDLLAVAGGTQLTLCHRLLQADQAVGYGAGWHAHLAGLAGLLEGSETDWDRDFAAELPRYRELAG